MPDSETDPAYLRAGPLEVHPLTLSFIGSAKGLEAAFRDDYYARSIAQARGSLFLVLFYYIFFGLLDARLIPGQAMWPVYYVRYGVVCPVLGVVLLFSYTRWFKPVMQPVLSFLMVLVGAGIVMVLVVAPPPLNFAYYVGLILVFIHAYTFTKIRFFWATLAGWSLVVLYEIVTVWVIETPAAIMIGNNFLLICASVVGMLTCYSMEYFERRNFLLQHLLRTEHGKVNAANQELEHQVAARTRDLTRINENLNVKIEQNLRMMEELSEAKDFSESLIASLQDGLAVFDTDGFHTDVNPAFCEMTGYRREEIVGVGIPHPYWPPEDRAMLTHIFTGAGKAPMHTIETALVRKDGTRLSVLVSPAPVQHARRDLTGYVVTFKDIHARKKAEDALARSEAKYRAILASMEELYFELDLAGRFTFVNDAVTRFSGFSREELLKMGKGWHASEENGDHMFAVFSQVHRTGMAASLDDFAFTAKNGEKKHCQFSAYLMRDKAGNPIGFKGIGRDTTQALADAREKRVLESHLRQSQKMEAVGTLAGGIAHDFNNILSAIMAYVEAVLIDPADPEKVRARLLNVKKACMRAKELIRQILTFSRNAEQDKKPVAIPFLTREALKLLRASLPSTIEIRHSADPDIGRVMADPTQIHQVLMNLCANAEHAMRKGGGVLEVALDSVALGKDGARFPTDLPPGRYVLMTVADTGHGMDQELIKRIFDPYFTTKEKGEGTGLGLSVVHGIVEACGGAIEVESEPGKGTRFSVYFPETAAEEALEPLPALAAEGTESILLVDDEPDLLDSFKTVLGHFGYQVSTLESSVDALRLFRDNPEAFDLIITDQTMPQLTGLDLAREVFALRPSMPVILCTGYSSDAASPEDVRATGIREMVMKPFAFEDFMQIVRRVLDEPGTGAGQASPAPAGKKPEKAGGEKSPPQAVESANSKV